MPLQGLGAGVAALVIEQVVRDGAFDGGAGTPPGEQGRLLLLAPRCFGWRLGVLVTLGLGIQLGALCCGARFRDVLGGLFCLL